MAVLQANRIHDLGRLFFLIGQLGMLLIIIRQFELVSGAFLRVALVAFMGFPIHHLLPARLRLPIFLLLSVLGIALVMGPADSAWLVALGLLLIGTCHLPVGFAARVALLLLIGALFASLRTGWLHAPWSQAIWPVLGSMFMFRLAIYLYDLRHGNAPASFWHGLCYFFMLPNVCFPLFPVVDYQRFHSNYYDRNEFEIYQVGIDWMMRGVLHLILYRVVYYYLILDPSEVETPQDLAQFIITTFLLYLKVSGQFHIIVGMLHLFGFNLPETNRLYCLASSFTDFWRRTNIYWKDFMMKLFYYPMYFQLRRYGTSAAIVLSTLLVFVITWALHSYQWFWLRGSFPVTAQDGIYWTALAVLVAANALYEVRFGRRRRLKTSVWQMGGLGRRVLGTFATFAVVCILWSMWATDTLDSWLTLWTALEPKRMAETGLVPVVLVAGLALGARQPEGGVWRIGLARALRVNRTTLVTLFWLVVVGLVGIPAVYSQLGTETANLVLSLRSDRLNRLDAAQLERGYYENLIQVDRFNDELWDLYMNRPVRWLDVRSSFLTRFTGDFRQQELTPSMMSASEFGTIRTNRWGMRDQDYERIPAPGAYRIAMLGSSVEMGWGVEDGETFEALLEARLNREHVGVSYDAYEILNFGVPGYYPLQQVAVLDHALAFAPDAVLYMAHGRELSRAAWYLADVVRKEIEIPYPELVEIVRRAGIKTDMPESVALRQLRPFQTEILSWLYHRIARECRTQGILPVLVFLPQTEGGSWEEETPTALRLAEAAGFITLNLENVFEGLDQSAIQLTDWDKHPNARGHRIIAERLYEALRHNPALSRPMLSAGAGFHRTERMEGAVEP